MVRTSLPDSDIELSSPSTSWEHRSKINDSRISRLSSGTVAWIREKSPLERTFYILVLLVFLVLFVMVLFLLTKQSGPQLFALTSNETSTLITESFDGRLFCSFMGLNRISPVNMVLKILYEPVNCLSCIDDHREEEYRKYLIEIIKELSQSSENLHDYEVKLVDLWQSCHQKEQTDEPVHKLLEIFNFDANGYSKSVNEVTDFLSKMVQYNLDNGLVIFKPVIDIWDKRGQHFLVMKPETGFSSAEHISIRLHEIFDDLKLYKDEDLKMIKKDDLTEIINDTFTLINSSKCSFKVTPKNVSQMKTIRDSDNELSSTSNIDWLKVLNLSQLETNVSSLYFEELSENYLTLLDNFLNKNKKQFIYDYLVWKIIEFSLPYSSESLRNQIGSSSQKSRDNHCLDVIKEPFGLVLSNLLFEKINQNNSLHNNAPFQGKSELLLDELSDELQYSAEKLILNQNWLTYNQKKLIKNHLLDEISYLIDQDRLPFNYKMLNDLYAELEIKKDDYFENILRIRRWIGSNWNRQPCWFSFII